MADVDPSGSPTPTPSRIRRVTRVPRPGFQFASSRLSDSTSGAGQLAEEDDDTGETEDINESVRRIATAPVSTPAYLPPVAPPSDGDRVTPRIALQRVQTRSSEEAKEYRLDLVRRMLLTRRFTALEIADQLGVSVATIHRDRKELARRFRDSAKSLDINEMIGEGQAFYREATSIAMRAASADGTPVAIRLAAVRTGLAATNDMHRFFETAGVYSVLQYKAAEAGGSVSDIDRLLDASERILSGPKTSDFSTAVNSGDDEEISL